jgi:L-rhamnose mutarotase
MTQRRAFILHVRRDKIDEYVEAHASVWPEMVQALRDAGIRNFSIFRDDNQFFGYFESDDLEAADAFLATQDVTARWEEAMAKLLEAQPPEAGQPLQEVFRLD